MTDASLVCPGCAAPLTVRATACVVVHDAFMGLHAVTTTCDACGPTSKVIRQAEAGLLIEAGAAYVTIQP